MDTVIIFFGVKLSSYSLGSTEENSHSMKDQLFHLPHFCLQCRLISERELSLYDGTRLFHHERYKAIKEENDWTNEDMNSR